MEKKHSIYIPVRLATESELIELVCGVDYCPACDCEIVGNKIMNKLPYVNAKDKLDGWICDICDTVFDLKDNVIQIGDFDSTDIYKA
tara:strand:- start:320 stop:580 length:261 start_codon:yes stop_codon:yes gene_type:complete